MIIVSAVAELERKLIMERVRAGLRRARLEGRVLGRKPIAIDRVGLQRDRAPGLSLAPAGQGIQNFPHQRRKSVEAVPKRCSQHFIATHLSRRH